MLQPPSEPLSSGRTADIYPWGEGTVLKRFRPWLSRDAVEAERRKTAAVVELGLAAPSVGDLVDDAAGIGLVMERLEGRSMMEPLLHEPGSVEPLARLLAELHDHVHTYRAPADFPAQREVLARRISENRLLSPAAGEALGTAISRLPAGDRLCHGDFHPGNVMLTESGPRIIDWIDAVRGNPVADVARSSLLFLGHIETRVTDERQRAAMRLFHDTYLATRLAGQPGRWAEYRQWWPIMAAARLCEGIDEQEDWLLQQVHAAFDR